MIYALFLRIHHFRVQRPRILRRHDQNTRGPQNQIATSCLFCPLLHPISDQAVDQVSNRSQE
jgi:hypothetical protein